MTTDIEQRLREAAPMAMNGGILREAADEIAQLRKELEELHNGDRAVLPKTKDHADKLYIIAVASLKNWGVDVEAMQRALAQSKP